MAQRQEVTLRKEARVKSHRARLPTRQSGSKSVPSLWNHEAGWGAEGQAVGTESTGWSTYRREKGARAEGAAPGDGC